MKPHAKPHGMDTLADSAERPLSLKLSAKVLGELDDQAARLEGTTTADIAAEVLGAWAKRPRQRQPS